MFKQLLEMKKISAPKKGVVFIVCFALFISGGLKILLGFIYQEILNHINVWESSFIILLLVISLLLIIVSSLSFYCYRKIRVITSEQKFHEFKTKTIDSYLKTYQSDKSLGNFQTLMGTDLGVLSRFSVYTWYPFIVGMALFIVALFAGMFVSMKLTLVILLGSISSVIISKAIEKRLTAKVRRRLEAKEGVEDIVLRFLNQIEIIKAYGLVLFSTNRILKETKNQLENNVDEESHRALISGVQAGVGFTISSIWLVYGAYLIGTNQIGMGEFAFFLGITQSLNWPFFVGASYWEDCVVERVSYERVCEYFNFFQSIKREDGKIMDTSIKENYLSLQNISFRYPESDDNVIEDISFKVREQSHFVIVGRSGAGKTTLLNIITSDLKGDTGNVFIQKDGKRLHGNMMWEELSIMPQRHILFNCSLLENITFEKDVDRVKLNHIIQSAKLESVIAGFSGGLDTIMSDDMKNKLSIGQIQRIMLARALYKDASYLILDEFSSAIDHKTKHEIIEILQCLDCSIISVAHDPEVIERLSEDGQLSLN